MNRIPGPDGHPLLGLLFTVLHTPPNKRMEKFLKYYRAYGSIYRTWIGWKCVVNVANAEHAQIILSSLDHVNKSKIYSLFEPWLGSGMFLSAGEKWAERRKIFAPSFHTSLLKDFVGVMVKNSQILIGRLDAKANLQPFDLYPYIADCSLDIIGETALGVHLNVQNGQLPEFIKNIHKFTSLLADRIQNLLMEFNFIHRFTSNYRKQREAVDVLHDISMKIIRRRIEERRKIQSTINNADHRDAENNETKTKKAFLDTLLDASEKEEKLLTLTDVQEELDGFIFAAFDSVSTSVSWTCFLIGHHPEVQARIHAEVDAVLESDERQLLNLQTINKLQYLANVYKESLRLYSPVPIIARNLGKSVRLGEYKIPAGTNVLIHVNLIHRSPEYYSHPDEFDPQREYTHPNAFLPFVAGPRNCMGQKFGMVEALTMLAMIFMKFEIQSLTSVKDMTTIWNLIWRPEHGISVKMKRRK